MKRVPSVWTPTAHRGVPIQRAARRPWVTLVTAVLLGMTACTSDSTGPTSNEPPVPPPPPPSPPIAIASVVVTPESTVITSLGETTQLSAGARDPDGNPLAGKTFVWASSNPNAVTVGPSGSATAVSNGEATITATAEGVQGTASVTVVQEAATISVTPASATLTSLGETAQLSVNAVDANGNAIADPAISWSSSDEDVLTVDASGLATAVLNGSAVVTATSSGISATATMTVDQVAVTLAFIEEPTTAEAGLSFAAAPAVSFFDGLGNVIPGATGTVTVGIGTNPNDGTLSGTKTRSLSGGVALFDDLSIDRDGLFTLTITSAGLASASSLPFTVTPCSDPGAAPARRSLCVVDPVGDNLGHVDLVKMVMTFDDTTGDYQVFLTADAAAPFVGSFRVNLNLYNPDAPSLFQDVINDFNIAMPSTTLILQGNDPALTVWNTGDRVFTNSLDGTPNPPGTTLFRSSAGSFPRSFLTNEDTLAFAKRPLPAIVQ